MLTLTVFFDTGKFETISATRLRGYIAAKFPECALLHHHKEGGDGVFYNYPRIQYKILNGMPVITALEVGCNPLRTIKELMGHFDLAGTKLEIVKKTSIKQDTFFGVATKTVNYSFLTPWLALNQKNYEKYQMLGMRAKRKAMLESILVGNLISISKSLGYTVPAPIIAHLGRMKEVKTSLKGIPMLGFLGEFSVNFDIPDYWGIGKSVSRGFGTVKRVQE